MDLQYYIEMALKGNYKSEMDKFKENPRIKAPVTNKQTQKEIQAYLKENIDDEIMVRILKRDKTKTFDTYYEIDLSGVYKNTGDNAALFKKIVKDVRDYMNSKNISKYAYELFVKNVGILK